ncbi:hypothetical protein KOAAANKH_00114 [Brevundimonas sp. NIBR10]|uniref:hypothetical protein n=1 Tax=Brevundimonas sp. NIBR10 TaxID=3015997 RepID=UPI0022F19CF2|nr:hypothetical protein [Brevundimonas sp. NIBR10]WGM45253.1 hypothetical protein KOAAANKH_00114 [Brevundimonas sp. NIBR10]
MVAYSFKTRFGPLIQSRAKTQTVRADRKRHARPGETLQLYTGMRTRSCRLLATATCAAVSPIRFDFDPAMTGRIEVHGVSTMHLADLDHFARSDGFEDWADLKRFWAREHPGLEAFEGVLIRWDSDSLVLP